MKIFKTSIFILLASPILFIKCHQSAEKTVKSPTFTVGILAPLTGILSIYGKAIRNGIKLAEIRNAPLFTNINLIFEDNKYTSSDTIKGFQRILFKNRPYLVYSWGEIPYNAISSMAKGLEIPLLITSLDATPGINNPLAIRVGNASDTLVGTLVKYLRDKGYKKFGIVKVEDPYINACIDGFKKNLLVNESIEIITTAQPEETNLQTHALKIQKNKYDAIGIYLNPGQISSFYQQMTALNMTVPTFGTDIFESQTEINSSGKIIEGAVFPNFKIPHWFKEDYQENFHDSDQISYAYNAYVFAVITGSVLSKLKTKVDPYTLIDLFKAEKDNSTLLRYEYKESKNGDKFFELPVVVKAIHNGMSLELH